MIRFSRPSSAASSVISDQSSLTGSEEDLHKPEFYSQSCEPTSSLHLLAANFQKLEKEKEKKMGGRGSWNLGDKLKSARRSSKKISNYAFSKLGEGQEVIRRRLKKVSKGNRHVIRDVHSDTEEDQLSTQSTPLLFSVSASTQNLSSSALGVDLIKDHPPPKPPRTFKTKHLQDLVVNCPDNNSDGDEGETVFLGDTGDDFSSDVLSAISDVGAIYSLDEGAIRSLDEGLLEGIANGRIPSSAPAPSSTTNGKHILRSESSPQLSLTTLIQNGDQLSLSDASPRLQTISEATDSAHLDNDPSSPSRRDNASSPDERLVHSVPLRRKTASPTTSDLHSLPSPFSLPTKPDDAVLSLPPNTLSEPDSNNDNKRFSTISTTSAEFFSAESSDGCNSLPPSPDLLDRSCILPSISPRKPEQEVVSAEEEQERERVLSSLSTEEEKFNTPPSSPYSSSDSFSPTNNKVTGVVTLVNNSHVTVNNSHVTKSDGSMTPTSLSSSTPSPTLGVFGNTDTLRPGHMTDATPTHDTGTLRPSHLADATSTLRPSHVTDTNTDILEPDLTDTPTHGTSYVNGGSSHSSHHDDVDGGVFISVVEEEGEVEVQIEVKVQGSTQKLELEPKENPVIVTQESSESTFFSESSEDPSTPTELRAVAQSSRRRCQTVSESAPVTVRGKRNQISSITSMDDNFQTEFDGRQQRLSSSDGLVSYFSQQDLEDIFKGKSKQDVIAKEKIGIVEEEEEGGEEAERVEGVTEPEEGVVEEEEELRKESDENQEVEEPIADDPEQATIIPDDISPDKVT